MRLPQLINYVVLGLIVWFLPAWATATTAYVILLMLHLYQVRLERTERVARTYKALLLAAAALAAFKLSDSNESEPNSNE